MSTSIFTFDHGQKKLNNAIGVKQDYLDDLNTSVETIIDSYYNDAIKDDENGCAPSELVEIALTQFSYSQLVILASFHLRMAATHKALEVQIKEAKDRISVESVNMDEMKEFFNKLRDRLTRRDEDED